ncbi:hypothetical protein [Chryseobacterium caseinilyticum]|uniref:Uncharacterized protein n=1 Tax=Chryseobacterium caseinilyticum TaxID=2771428 RepID=A0ABR8ZG64_9FLAO|nr:hypothetical protein [Chryseobacterium caseinilyticum]MBD8084089.1 hypothetical protein [Chryseobacterium caseinilyticum]
MNIAFTTIIVFIILAPGFLARIAYHSSKLSVSNPNKNIVNELTLSIIPALIIQIAGIFLVNTFSDFLIDFQTLGHLILGATNNNAIGNNFKKIDEFKYQIFFYNLFVFSFAFFSGYIIRRLVRITKADRKIRYFRFSNKWHYIFSGECLDFPDVPDNYENITEKIVNVLCKVNGKNVLYTGTLFNYFIDANGNLEAVHLKFPIRRLLEDDDEEDYHKKYYEIESRYLVIPNNDIININFRYFNLVEVNEQDLTPEELNNIISLNENN